MFRLAAMLIACIVAAASFSLGAEDSAAKQPFRGIWIELSANLPSLASEEKIRQTLRNVSGAGFTHIILEAKSTLGYVSYQSRIAPRINDLDAARNWYPEYAAPDSWLPPKFDILQTAITEGKKQGLKICAAIQTMTEGHNEILRGPAFLHPEWQSVYYMGIVTAANQRGSSRRIADVNSERGGNRLMLFTHNKFRGSKTTRQVAEVLVVGEKVRQIRDRAAGKRDPGPLSIPSSGYLLVGRGTARHWISKELEVGDRLTISAMRPGFVRSGEQDMLAFVNPAHPEVVRYETEITREIVRNYDIDCFVLDRARYAGVTADFSDFSRKAFEQHRGQAVGHWPEDILQLKPSGYWFIAKHGPLFYEWVAWRALTLRQVIGSIRDAVKNEKPDILFINYVGSWYSRYWNEGPNWGSREYAPPYSWTTTAWSSAGTAELYDYLLVGTFTAASGIAARMQEANRAVKGKTRIIPGISARVYAGNPAGYEQALREALKNPDGIMVFDYSDVERMQWWRRTKIVLNNS